MYVRAVESASMPDWDRYVAGHPDASAYHQSGWRRVIERVFARQTFYLVAEDEAGIRGALPLVRLRSLLFGDFVVSMPYLNYGGLLYDSLAARDALVARCVELARELGLRHVELRHTHNEFDLPVRADRLCMRLSLPQDVDELWKRLGSKLRAQVKRPLSEGAKAVRGGRELIDDFYRIFARKYRQLGVPVYPRLWFEALLEEFADRIAVEVVYLAGVPAAAGIVVDYRESTEVAWAASLREADRLGANMYLYWNMLANAAERGQSVFDFGRTTEGSGTWRFKKQWGAEPVPLYWHYVLGTAAELPRLNLDNPTYGRAAAIWRHLPLRVTNSIGPLLIRNLP